MGLREAIVRFDSEETERGEWPPFPRRGEGERDLNV